MNTRLNEIERLVIGSDNAYVSFDTWGADTRSMLYFFLADEFKEKDKNYFTGNFGRYIVSFNNGRQSRGGMDMGSPEQAIVEKVKERVE